MSKKKLLFITNSLHGGGAEKVLQTILNNLSSNKYDITLYSVNEDTADGKYPDWIKIRHIFRQKAKSPIDRLLLKATNKIKLFIYYHFPASIFYRMFVSGEYDAEIAFIEGYATRIVSGSPHKHSRKIAWVHIDLSKFHWTDIAYRNPKEEQTTYYKFNLIACVSNDVKNSMRMAFPKLNNLETIYNPIDDKAIRNSAPDADNHILQKHIRLISIGRLVVQKGYDRLLPIIKRLRDDGHNITLTILGEGAERARLEAYIRGNELSDVVSLPGYAENPYREMAMSDIFVCSSRSEGYSTAITEALILGLPVITTECSGSRELLGDNEYGIITDNNEDALYKGIAKLITSPDEIIHFSNKARERGTSFSLDSLMHTLNNKILHGI